MTLYTTTFQAIDPSDGELKQWQGEHIPAISFSHAQEICRQTKGHLVVSGRLEQEIDEMTGAILFDAKMKLN